MTPRTLDIVIEPVHYGAGVRTFRASEPSLEADGETAIEMQPSFEAAVAYWKSFGWANAEVIDDAYGRYVVRLSR